MILRESKQKIKNDNKDLLPDIKLGKVSENKIDLLNSIIDNFITAKSLLINAVERKLLSKEELRKEIKNFLEKEKYEFHEGDLDKIYSEFKSRIWGYGPLDKLLGTNKLSDIRVVGSDNVRIKVGGKRLTSDVKFSSEEALKDFIVNKVAHKNHITLSDINAIQRVTDKTTSDKYIIRIDISSEIVNEKDYPYLHMRLIPKEKYLLEDLKNMGMINEEILAHIKKSVKAGLGILICGKTGSGKTYLTNALIEEIPHTKSGLFVQESEELFCNTHPELIFQVIKEPGGESRVQYTLADLIKNALVSDYDYLGVGEIKGAEAWDLVNAAYTGSIPIANVHSLSAEAAPRKLVHYMKYSSNSKDFPEDALSEMLIGFDEILFVKDFKVQEITQIAGYKNGLIFNPVFKYKVDENTAEFVKLNDDCNKVKEKFAYSKYMNSKKS